MINEFQKVLVITIPPHTIKISVKYFFSMVLDQNLLSFIVYIDNTWIEFVIYKKKM